MSFINSYRYAPSGIPNICGTGNVAPPGWVYLHDVIPGGIGSWGNMPKVNGYNNFAANVENIPDGITNVCYKDGAIDFAALNAFFTVNADVEIMYDQFGFDNAIDDSAGLGYIKLANRMNFNGSLRKSTLLNASGIASLRLGSACTFSYVLDYTSLPAVNISIFCPLAGANFLNIIWSGNGVDLIVRFQAPNQGYFYSGLRAAGTKHVVITYDGTVPINRSGLKLYWNGVLQTPAGFYNSGAPANNFYTRLEFGLPTNANGYFEEFDLCAGALTAAQVTTAKTNLEQRYTFS